MPNPEDRMIETGQPYGNAGKQQAFISQTQAPAAPSAAPARASRSQASGDVMGEDDPELMEALDAPPEMTAPGFAMTPGPPTIADLYRGLAETLPSPDLVALAQMSERYGL